MISIVLKGLRARYGSWLGAFILTTATAATVAAAMSQIETGLSTSGEPAALIASYAGPMGAIAVVVAVIVQSSVIARTVSILERDFALLKLGGLLPNQVFGLVVAQNLVISFLAVIAGVLVGRAAAPIYFNELSPMLDLRYGVELQYGPITWIGTAVVILIGSTVSSFKGALAASRATELRVVSDSVEMVPKRRLRSWIGSIASLIVVAGVGLLYSQLQGDARAYIINIVTVTTLLLLALTLLAASSAHVVLPLLIRCWTALLPAKISTSWALAKRSCAFRVKQSTATIVPLSVAIAISAGLLAILHTSDNAMRFIGRLEAGQSTVNVRNILIVLSGALIVCAVAAAVVVLISNRSREREYAVRLSAGDTTSGLVLSAVFEAVIYILTAVLLAAIIVGITLGVQLLVLWNLVGPVPVGFQFDVPVTLVVCGFVLVMAGVLAPAMRSISLNASE